MNDSRFMCGPEETFARPSFLAERHALSEAVVLFEGPAQGRAAQDRRFGCNRGSMRFWSRAALTVALLAQPLDARANGRFPESNHVYLSPSDPDEVIVRVSFGLLISRDGGGSFRWLCEQALGVIGVEDPMYAYLKGGGIVASTFQGLIVSRDRSCSWPQVASVGSRVFIDLTQRPSERDYVLALESSYDKQDAEGGISFINQVWKTIDDAQNFAPLGPALDPTLLGYTIDIAPSDPSRVYVSANRNPGVTPKGVILVSRDGAQTWEELPIALENNERSPWIAAVDPTNPDRLYVRTKNTVEKPARLLLSDNGGKTFRTIFTSQGDLLGFSLSPDASKVYVGGPRDGLNVASTADFAFRKTSDVEVQCITATADRLWVCSAETSGFIVARTSDEGATFEGRTRFIDIRGPLDCPSSPQFDICVNNWPVLKATLGFPGADADSDADAAGPAASAASARAGSGGSSGCGCRATSATEAGGLLALLATTVSLVLRRRRT